MLMSGSKVRLFVKSVKTVTGTKEFEHATWLRRAGARPDRIELEGKITTGTFRVKAYETETEPAYDFVLPEDQEKVVEMVTEAASKKGLQLEVIDVTKENILHRAIQEELKKIHTFPTIIVGSAQKIEGRMTKEQIDDVLSRVQSEVRKKEA
jgi:glutaredoxin